jgi:hypothetical protein
MQALFLNARLVTEHSSGQTSDMQVTPAYGTQGSTTCMHVSLDRHLRKGGLPIRLGEYHKRPVRIWEARTGSVRVSIS